MASQLDKVTAFRALHAADEGFIIPNPWDAGSAVLLESLGFKALASTSAGFAWSHAKPDNGVAREALMVHLAEMAAATSIPINADLENGFGDLPEECAKTIRLAAETGIAGGSIEDSTGRAGDPLYARELAADRVRAAVEAARSLKVPFVLTARAENYFVGKPGLADVISRLQAYQEAGADVLYAPGLVAKEDIETVLKSVDRPVNVLLMPSMKLTAPELLAMGAQRISIGGAFARAAYGEFMRAAKELRDSGTMAFGATAMPGKELNEAFRLNR
jgi:2-methylisocitrate lyase-like PEP mutase family enzyme